MKFFLFASDVNLAKKAEIADIDYVLVDWERKGKLERQSGHNLEINKDGSEEVTRLSKSLNIPVTVRVNPVGEYTYDEVNLALDCGAKVIMLPMSKTIKEVEEFLRIVNNRAETLIQIETPEMVNLVKELRELPWDYAHVGLNDLMVAKGNKTIWRSLIDGTVEKVCSNLECKKYGFGGITILGGGSPIPFNLILHEMVRLKCSMGILRRSFKSEMLDRNMKAEINLLRNGIETSKKRGQNSMKEDHKLLIKTIKNRIYNE